MKTHNFKKGDKVKVKTISHTEIDFGHNEDMYNVGDTFIISCVNYDRVEDDNYFNYHPDDLELIIDEIPEKNEVFTANKFLKHLNLKIIKS